MEIFGIPESVARHVETTIAVWQGGLIGKRRLAFFRRSLPVGASEYCYPETRDAVRMDCVLQGQSFRVWLEAGEIAEEIGPRLERALRERARVRQLRSGWNVTATGLSVVDGSFNTAGRGEDRRRARDSAAGDDEAVR